MFVVQVRFSIRPECAEDFVKATFRNVSKSRLEPGVEGFEFYGLPGGANEYMLIEKYRSAVDQERHRETAHYREWKAKVTDLLASPYVVTKLDELI
jgi:quinol monooxygenase YgiN